MHVHRRWGTIFGVGENGTVGGGGGSSPGYIHPCFVAALGGMVQAPLFLRMHPFIAGLAWDPLNVYFASQSSDRQVNLYLDGNKKLLQQNGKPPAKKRDGRFELDAAIARDEVRVLRRFA